MNAEPNYSRRRFLQKAGIGLGAAVLVCSGSTALAVYKPEVEWIETSFNRSASMNNKILVTYASKTGSTGQIAETIGKILGENGIPVDIMPVETVTSLDEYRAVVIGSAIRYGAVLSSAAAFVKNNADVLKGKPFAIFTAGSTLFNDTPENRVAVAAYTAPQKALVPPVSTADFAGVYDPKRVSFAERLLGKATKTPEGDFRNWDAINQWAESLQPVLLG